VRVPFHARTGAGLPPRQLLGSFAMFIPRWKRKQLLRPEEEFEYTICHEAGVRKRGIDVGIKTCAYPVQLGVNGG
jgi:hypothetical protein